MVFNKNHFKGALSISLIGPLFEESLLKTHKIFHDIIFVDGGANFQSLFNAQTSLSIGDNDSCKTKLDVTFPKEKDESDLSLALNYVPDSCKSLHLYGFLGGRSDHELGVLGELHSKLLNSQSIKVIYSYHTKKKWILINDEDFFLTIFGEFSIFTLYKQNISISGEAKYTGDEITLTPLSTRGLSNIGSGEINIKSSHPLLIIQDDFEKLNL
jgi:thiamine pyrophosphokinase